MEGFRDAAKGVVDVLRSPRLSLTALFAALAFLALPSRWSVWLGVAGMASEFRPVFGVVLILSAANLATFGADAGRRKWIAKRNERLIREIRESRMRKLTTDEKRLLIRFDGDRGVVHSDTTDGIANALIHKEILYRTSNVFEPHRMPLGLQPWARQYLDDHPEVLAGVERPKARSEKRSDSRW